MRFIYYESNLYLINVAKCCWFERSCARIVLGITLKSAKQIRVWLSTAQEIFLNSTGFSCKKIKSGTTKLEALYEFPWLIELHKKAMQCFHGKRHVPNATV